MANKRRGTGKDDIKEIPVHAPPEIRKGCYSNVAIVHHTEREFIMDFLLRIGGEAQLVSRVIFSPDHMRSFRDVIDDNLRIYENKYGHGENE